MLIFIGGNNMPVYKDKNKGTWYVKYTIEDLPTGTKNVLDAEEVKLLLFRKVICMDISFIFAIHR